MANEELKSLNLIIDQHKDRTAPLMPVLHAVQGTFGCISYNSQIIISKELKISLSQISGVVTFYSGFTVEPRGKNIIGVCMGTACYVKGAKLIFREVTKILGAGLGETTVDGLFTIAPTRCLGDCSKAPAVVVNNIVYGNLNVEDIKDIISKY
ncbi:MAG: NAD(P)H-dependent oxidoreductase subunit E [Spirochaetaceae bacterium]